MTATATRPMPATARPCPDWCDPTGHIVEEDGTVLHLRAVGLWSINLMDHALPDGTRGWGEAVVDTNLGCFTTAADAREIATELEQIAVILEGMDHVTTVFDSNIGPWPA